MVRISKQGRRRAVSPRRRKNPSVKTGPKKDALPQGYKPRENALPDETSVFIGRVR